MNHAPLDRLTGSSDSMMWRQNADHEQKRETGDVTITRAFRFLLDREPKESILRRFDVMTISRYFPEFERELPRYLSQF